MELKFQESQKSCGSDRGDCHDSGLAGICQQCHMSVVGCDRFMEQGWGLMLSECSAVHKC